MVAQLVPLMDLGTVRLLDTSGRAPIHVRLASVIATSSQSSFSLAVLVQWACLVNSLGCIKTMVRESGESRPTDLLCLTTAENRSLLHLAVLEGSSQVAVVCLASDLRMSAQSCAPLPPHKHAFSQLLGILLESGSGVLRFKLLEADDYGETALALAVRLGHDSCKAMLEAKVQQLIKPNETLIELVGSTLP